MCSPTLLKRHYTHVKALSKRAFTHNPYAGIKTASLSEVQMDSFDVFIE